MASDDVGQCLERSIEVAMHVSTATKKRGGVMGRKKNLCSNGWGEKRGTERERDGQTNKMTGEKEW